MHVPDPHFLLHCRNTVCPVSIQVVYKYKEIRNFKFDQGSKKKW